MSADFALFDLTPTFGRVQMAGRTRLEFLHRMSTGDVLKLREGEGRGTVLTTAIGRMIDYTPVLALDDAVILLTGGGNAARVVQWLRKYVLYNDDVKVHDISGATQMLGVFGAHADEWIRAVDPQAQAHLQNAPVYAHVQQGSQMLVKAPPLQGAGYYLIGVDVLAKMASQIAGQMRPIAEYEALRIGQGMPAFPGEISEDYIPLEAGLWDAVSFSKGCYIGQEIIARMESRNQMAKKLVQLEMLADDAVLVPDTDVVEGAVVAVTSQSGHRVLAYVRSAAANVGQILRLQNGQGLAKIVTVHDRIQN